MCFIDILNPQITQLTVSLGDEIMSHNMNQTKVKSIQLGKICLF